VRVAREFKGGRARLMLSMANWGDEPIAPATVEMTVEDAKPTNK